ncbi:hypothetical protein [Oricola thermophila]|uniref:Phage tail assembly protein n=1 Tax=Oricola thermophila TaxID=2742145 RepID=A0A6N1VFW2_9HYPH|nr:hypothetical protein [Oricola thermophila]QKV17857.1 hypothetical protein HTY61_04980 [Oricola thermophila]
MADKPKIGAGNVEIELDGVPYTLKPTLRAARMVSQNFGGFQKALAAIGNLDLDAYVSVIAAGVGAKASDVNEIAEAVWRTGMPGLADPVVTYLTNLANGGRPLDNAGGSGDENPQTDQ